MLSSRYICFFKRLTTCAEAKVGYFSNRVSKKDFFSKTKIKSRETIYVIDKTFIDVCEDDTINASSVVPSSPCMVGAKVDGNLLKVNVEPNMHFGMPEFIVVKLTGIRRGRKDSRFPKFTEEQMNDNSKFWDQWKKQ